MSSFPQNSTIVCRFAFTPLPKSEHAVENVFKKKPTFEKLNHNLKRAALFIFYPFFPIIPMRMLDKNQVIFSFIHLFKKGVDGW